MKKVLAYSLLLVFGVVGSQFLPGLFGSAYGIVSHIVTFLTMAGLSFIMIHVGYEFEIDKSNLRQYGWDYVVAMTAAAFPWIFVTAYFLFVMLPPDAWQNFDAWKETLIAGRFAAPTSAGVLFSMLAAAGLSATWLFKKARILAIFDDLDTVLLMIPLKMMMVGLAWQLGAIVAFMALLLWIGWKWMHDLAIPTTWKWVLSYALGITAISEVIYYATGVLDDTLPIHIEVLLPAFVLGMVMKIPAGTNPHVDDEREGHQEGPEAENEQRVSGIISGVFMVLVGLSMPSIIGGGQAVGEALKSVTGSQPMIGWGTIAIHVLVVTVISNIGKMFPAFVYRKEAHWRERLAVAIGMWPRGEVGAGILILSISYGLGGPVVTVAMISLALNLVLTGVFIMIVKKLLRGVPGTGHQNKPAGTHHNADVSAIAE
jgi:Na+:H+ antiporter